MRKSKYSEGQVCSVESCDRLRRKREWCEGHYSRWRKYGDTLSDKALPPLVKSPYCTISGCDYPEYSSELCASHYNQYRGITVSGRDASGLKEIDGLCMASGCRNSATADGVLCKEHIRRKNRKSTSFEKDDLLFQKIVTDTGCWIKPHSRTGVYTHVTVKGRNRGAHRVAYSLWIGSCDVDDLGDELYVLHHCDNPPCFNPDHLSLGTPTDNMVDASLKSRLRQGEGSHYSKLSEQDVRDIRSYYEEKAISVSEIADRYSIHKVTVYDIVGRKTWKHVGN